MTGTAVAELTRYAGLTLFDLFSPSCAPCRTLAPVLDDLAADFAGAIRVFKVDVSADPSVAEHFGPRAFPTLILYRDGEEIDRIVGLRSRAQLAYWIENHL
ncbi:co-chaperone YbbN [Croceicoccus sp. YJ47]|uniref:thioredoxin family protein n=1 Tax=Croceicoccus sp. YJ47 TaxID=2798724 RepID=UPI0019245B88|nr:thioredoxin family protein [Croceicoccus sp. YJ47]QQN74731.1 thioredoxin family protein [Croceicoccus sp. YJ47]